jgi:SAF domain
MAHLWRRISVAAAAFVLMAGVLGAARQRVIQPSPFPSVAVVVAARHLQAFSAIRPAQLHVVHQGWSPALLAGTLRQLIGHVLLNDVPAGQIVPAAGIGRPCRDGQSPSR